MSRLSLTIRPGRYEAVSLQTNRFTEDLIVVSMALSTGQSSGSRTGVRLGRAGRMVEMEYVVSTEKVRVDREWLWEMLSKVAHWHRWRTRDDVEGAVGWRVARGASSGRMT